MPSTVVESPNGIPVFISNQGTAVQYSATGQGIPVRTTASEGTPVKPFAPAYTPVHLIIGDSQARGSADDATAYNSAYVSDPLVQAVTSTPSVVTYAPGTNTGLNAFANTGNPGSEIGFFPRWKLAFPTKNLVVLKAASAGSFASRGTSLGTFTGSVTGNTLSVSAGTVALGDLIVAAGIPTGTYIASSAGGSDYFLATAGSTVSPSFSLSSTTVTRYPYTNSWSPTEGGLWNGVGGSVTNGYRQRIVNLLATMTDPRIIGLTIFLGDNDKSNSTTAAAFQSELAALITRVRADIPVGKAPIALVRPKGAGADPLVVRAGMAAVAATYPQAAVIDVDDASVGGDSLHYNISGLTTAGSRIFDHVIKGVPV